MSGATTAFDPERTSFPVKALRCGLTKKEPASGDDWPHEVKLDGYRMLAQIDAGLG